MLGLVTKASSSFSFLLLFFLFCFFVVVVIFVVFTAGVTAAIAVVFATLYGLCVVTTTATQIRTEIVVRVDTSFLSLLQGGRFSVRHDGNVPGLDVGGLWFLFLGICAFH